MTLYRPLLFLVRNAGSFPYIQAVVTLGIDLSINLRLELFTVPAYPLSGLVNQPQRFCLQYAAKH